MTSIRTTTLALFFAAALAAPALSFAQEEGGGEAPGAAPADGPGKRERMSKLFRIIQAEPSIKDTQRAAVKFYKLEMGRIHSMAGNARLKGLLCKVETDDANFLHRCSLRSWDAQASPPWHIAMPSGRGIHSIT